MNYLPQTIFTIVIFTAFIMFLVYILFSKICQIRCHTNITHTTLNPVRNEDDEEITIHTSTRTVRNLDESKETEYTISVLV